MLDKIFQPFLTTKPTGQGTGLGLSATGEVGVGLPGVALAPASQSLTARRETGIEFRSKPTKPYNLKA